MYLYSLLICYYENFLLICVDVFLCVICFFKVYRYLTWCKNVFSFIFCYCCKQLNTRLIIIIIRLPSEMTWFWISKGKLNYWQSKVCVSCWFFSRGLFQLKFLEEEANNWIEEPVCRLVMWEAERGNTVLYTIHIRAKNNVVQAWHRRNRGYMHRSVIEDVIWCTVSFQT